MLWTIATLFVLGAASTPEEAVTPPATLTLDEAITIAHENARSLVQARANLLLVDIERTRAWAAVLPRFDLTVRAYEQFEGSPWIELRRLVYCDPRREDVVPCPDVGNLFPLRDGPFTDQKQLNDVSHPLFRLDVTGRQLIYDGGRWWAVIARADDIERHRRAVLRLLENDVRLRVTHRFYGYEKARRAVETFRAQLESSEEQLHRARTLIAEGKGKKRDVATAERNFAEDRVNLARRQFNEDRAKRALNLELGRSASTPVTIVIPEAIATATAALAETKLPELEELRDQAVSHRPELDQERAEVEINKKNLTIREAGHWPTLSLGASYSKFSRRPDRVFNDPTENYYANLDLTLSWNLFNGRRVSADVQEGEILLAQSIADYEERERQVLGEVDDRFQNLMLQIEVYEVARLGLKFAEEAVELARSSFDQGRATALELRDAEQKLTQARLSTIDARMDVEIAREELRRVVGVDPFKASPAIVRSNSTDAAP